MDLFALFLALDDLLWTYLCPPLLVSLGLYFTWNSRFFQLRRFTDCLRLLKKDRQEERKTDSVGVPPLRAFFTSLGGCVGLGNIVGACVAIKVGGPGALFWMWITALLGMMVKYAEVFLGMRYRIKSEEGYSGGPVFILRKLFPTTILPTLTALFLCVYGIEFFQFRVVSGAFAREFAFPLLPVVAFLLLLVLYAGAGGVRRVGNICSRMIPLFSLLYVGMALAVIATHLSELPGLFATVFSSAFTGHAAVGGFAGGTALVAMAEGMRRACYSGDIGIGYAAVIHTQSSTQKPAEQAALTIVEIFLDSFVIVTVTHLLVLVTGVWSLPIEADLMVQHALAELFPAINYFMPLFYFLLGYSTIIAFFAFGLKASESLSLRWGKPLYFLFGTAGFLLFAFLPISYAITLQAIAGGCLLVINCYVMWKLKKEVAFDL